MGHDFDMSKASQLQPGVTTVNDAKEMFGPPTSITTSQDGHRHLYTWKWSEGSVIDGRAKDLEVVFDLQDKMIRIHHQGEVK